MYTQFGFFSLFFEGGGVGGGGGGGGGEGRCSSMYVYNSSICNICKILYKGKMKSCGVSYQVKYVKHACNGDMNKFPL
jgi:hypothetical protein